VPLSGELSLWTFGINGQQNSTSLPSALYYEVDPDYLHAMGIPLIQGRNFTESDNASSPHVCIINDFFARTMFPAVIPLASTFRSGIITPFPARSFGVVGSVKQAGLDDKETYQIYEAYAQLPRSGTTFIVQPPANQWRCSGRAPRPSSKLIRRNQWPSRARWSRWPAKPCAAAISHAAAGAIRGAGRRSSACGLYGSDVLHRDPTTQEIGIRMALGAQQRNIYGLIVLREWHWWESEWPPACGVAGDDPVAGGISVWSHRHATQPRSRA